MQFEAFYWLQTREEVLCKEGVSYPCLVSGVLCGEGRPYASVAEEIVGSFTWLKVPMYVRAMWLLQPIVGSRARAVLIERREITLAEYAAFRERGAAALPQIWRRVCSCGASDEFRWRSTGYPGCLGDIEKTDHVQSVDGERRATGPGPICLGSRSSPRFARGANPLGRCPY